jgi:hypothetical protein
MLKELLRNNTVRVSFIKRDGSHRDMLCTLQSDLIQDNTYSIRREPEDRVTVWDLEKQAWRCFKLDSITHYESVDVA